LRALLGEVAPLDTTEQLMLNGSISYASQVPFILNAAVRENILFGLNSRKKNTIELLMLAVYKPT